MIEVHKILYLGGQPTAVFIDLTKHIFGSSDMLQRNGALFEEVRPQQFAEKTMEMATLRPPVDPSMVKSGKHVNAKPL